MSDEELVALWNATWEDGQPAEPHFLRFARAVEAREREACAAVLDAAAVDYARIGARKTAAALEKLAGEVRRHAQER